MDYGALTRKLVEDAMRKLPGLTKTITVHYFVSDGGYNAETDSNSPVYEDVSGVVCVAAKPVFADIEKHNVVFTDLKLIIPGKYLPREPQTETDQVTINGERWHVRKCVGVPGESVYLVYVHRT
jgi:hypothetical protein